MSQQVLLPDLLAAIVAIEILTIVNASLIVIANPGEIASTIAVAIRAVIAKGIA